MNKNMNHNLCPRLGLPPQYDEMEWMEGRKTKTKKDTKKKYYQPIIKCHKHSNFKQPRGLVKISAQFISVAIFTIYKEPFLIWSWKWWNFKAMFFVHSLNVDSVVAGTIQAVLSSYILDAGMGDLKLLVFMVSDLAAGMVRNVWVSIYCKAC